MSEDQHHPEVSPVWADKILPIAMSICIAASSWFLNQAWTKISALEAKIQQIEVLHATNSSNRLTNTDWIAAKNLLDSNYNSLSLRVTRLEDNNVVIRDYLLEIKQILKVSK